MAKKARPLGRKAKKSFYASALSQAEQVHLPEAQEIEGLDEEIALLRVRLRSLMEQHPENAQLFLKGVEMLVKAVATRYRLSKKSKEDLSESITEVLKGIGSALWPEGFNGV